MTPHDQGQHSRLKMLNEHIKREQNRMAPNDALLRNLKVERSRLEDRINKIAPGPG